MNFLSDHPRNNGGKPTRLVFVQFTRQRFKLVLVDEGGMKKRFPFISLTHFVKDLRAYFS